VTSVPLTWDVRPLGDLVDILDSRRIPVSAPERAKRLGEIPYYGAAGPVGWIDKALFDEPLVLLGEDGVQFFDPNKSKSYLVDGPAWVNNHAHVLRAREIIERKFLNCYLNSADYRGFANGTTRLKLTQAAMKQIPVPVPPVSEQCRIVDLLEDHLSHIDAADRSVAASILRLNRLRDSALAEVVRAARSVEGTETYSLGDLAKVNSGMTPLRGNKAFYDHGTIPWITSGDLHQGHITKPTHFVTEKALAETSLKLLPAGALLIAMYGEGKTRGTAAELGIAATTNQACAAVALHDPELRPWVRLILDANYSSLRRLAAGGVQPNLNLSLVKAIQIPVPSTPMRESLISRLGDIDAGRMQLHHGLANARARGTALRRAVLDAAFSGRLTSISADLSEADAMIGV